MHEDLLRHIWSKQLFDASRLATTDGRAVRIFNPGILSRTSGPDFRNAVVEIGGNTYSGDIEFHRTSDDWKLHHHHNDPNYNSVILHVVFSGKTEHIVTHSGRTIPSIVLEPLLFSPLESMAHHLSREEYRSHQNSIRCATLNDSIDSAILYGWIKTMYRERLQEKIVRLHDRLCDIIITQQRVVGEPLSSYNDEIADIPLPDTSIDRQLFKQKRAWEQLLYEEIMDCLGYSNNRTPMKKISAIISLTALNNAKIDKEFTPMHIEALLLRTSGLLPTIHETADQDSKVYIHTLTSLLNVLPGHFINAPIDWTEWTFSPTRPSNFPTIRIAAASLLLHKLLYGSLFQSIITITEGAFSTPQSKLSQIALLLETGDHPFWNYHYSFTEPTHKKHSLLGTSRTHDIIVNAFIPFISLYAKIFGKESLLEHCMNIAFELPLLEDNSILRTMNKQLVKSSGNISAAYQQQGLLQLHKRYCSVDRCSDCAIGNTLFQH